MTTLITCNPDPCLAGGTVVVCFDFSSATSPVDLFVQWSGADDIAVQVSKEHPCVTLTVPKTAFGCIIEDESGQSEDYPLSVD